MADAPVLFFAPFVSSILRIDRGLASEGNVSGLGQYHALMEEALDELLTVIGFDRNYRDIQQSFVALVESHVTCQRNVSQGGSVRLTAQLIDCDDDRLHLYVELRHATDGWLAVSGEYLLAHIDLRSEKPIRFADPILGNLIVMRAAHARLPRPKDLGRRIGLRSQSMRLN